MRLSQPHDVSGVIPQLGTAERVDHHGEGLYMVHL